MNEPPTTTIRRAAPEDVDAIARLHVEAWRESYAGLLPAATIARLTAADRARAWRAILARGETDLFIALDRDGARGFVAAGRQRAEALEARFPGEIAALYLLRSGQGRGLGRALFERAGAALRARGLDPPALWVLEDNLQACGFYRHMGGVPVAARQERLGDALLREIAFGFGARDDRDPNRF